MAHAYVGRQPIFDRKLAVYAYELLFRRGEANAATVVDDSQATSQVVLNAFTEFGLDALVGDRRAFLNLGRDFLLDPCPLPWPRERVVLEILEHTCVDAPLIEAVRKLVAAGYLVALDDFAAHPQWQPLLQLAQIVKIDVRSTPAAELRELVRTLRPQVPLLLAEKVETRTEFEELIALGFDYFQGYFLARPLVVAGRRVPTSRLGTLRLLVRLHDPEVALADVEGLIRQDVSLSYRLLRYINSAFFALPRRVESVREAIIYLGLTALKRWVSLVALSGFDDLPSELVATALLRARMCERLAEMAGRPGPEAYFTVGLFSTLDALLERPMVEVLAQLPLGAAVSDALLTAAGPLGAVLGCVLAYERWDWTRAVLPGLTAEQIGQAYLQALGWVTEAAGALSASG